MNKRLKEILARKKEIRSILTSDKECNIDELEKESQILSMTVQSLTLKNIKNRKKKENQAKILHQVKNTVQRISKSCKAKCYQRKKKEQ